MMERESYLDEYLAFWTSRPEIGRVWLSIYTPQKGERSEEMLTLESRRRLFELLPALKRKYPALILPDRSHSGIQPFTPGSETLRVYTSFDQLLRRPEDNRRAVFLWWQSDCAQCGCAVSMALHSVHGERLVLGLKTGHVIDGSLAVGRFAKSMLG